MSLRDPPDTLARVYRGLTATSLLAGTLINDVLMQWHRFVPGCAMPGQESLFSDADGACGLEALAGRCDWGSLAQILVRAHFLTHVSQSVSSVARASVNDDFVITGLQPGLRCARSHTITAHTTCCKVRGTQYVHGTWYNAHCTMFRVYIA